jgi:hypothetical protein
MEQSFEESGFDVVVMGTTNADGKWRALAVFSPVGSRNQQFRASTTCMLQGDYATEQAAFDAAAEWALNAAKAGKVPFPA